MNITHAHKHTLPVSYQQACAKRVCVCACVRVSVCVFVRVCVRACVRVSCAAVSPDGASLSSHQGAALSWLSEAHEGGGGTMTSCVPPGLQRPSASLPAAGSGSGSHSRICSFGSGVTCDDVIMTRPGE